VTAPAYPNLHRIAYGEGARLTAEARVEAADALERLNRTCATCAHFYAIDFDANGCLAIFGLRPTRDFCCNRWDAQPLAAPLTPAHDKEKS